MTTRRRLDQVEGALAPLEVVLQWLEEALRIAYASGALSRAETHHDRRRRGLQ